ncbi:solute carrier family 25, member 39/40 [Geosmithia morbida]|uniref:Solute carrier family 25, member 39/40 n=1 Tax=Geosmithia morbida TaxID=1094350 RepID=A0A9P4YXH8_9HYPO|nr:solute carrier family 25, member 39/40 [Geosmithia morbida]KAF4124896.1 solute carrier family 25, member 39/40 [Geosmithia morbida]
MGPAVQTSEGQWHDRPVGAGAAILSMAGSATPPPPPGDVVVARGSEGASGSDLFEITTGQRMMSAMSGSLLTSLLVTPLDVVRVRLQSQQPRTSSKIDFSRLTLTANSLPIPASEIGVTACCREVFFIEGGNAFCVASPKGTGAAAAAAAAATAAAPSDCAVREAEKKTYRSTMDGLRKIARNEGVSTLWRGLSPTLAMAVPANIIYFTGYEWLRHSPSSLLSGLSDDYAPLTAGSVARILAATSVGPIELVRTRMQAASPTSTGNHMLEAFGDVRAMVGTRGYTSLWRGLSLTLWRDVPFSGLYWWGYEAIRSRLSDLRGRRHGYGLGLPPSPSPSPSRADRRLSNPENSAETFVDSFASGALSGAFASVVTTPFDVGKTRTQVYAGGSVGDYRRNMTRLLWHIFKTEGASGLWKGWIPRTLKVAPSCAIMISTYEVGKSVFKGINERAAAAQH